MVLFEEELLLVERIFHFLDDILMVIMTIEKILDLPVTDTFQALRFKGLFYWSFNLLEILIKYPSYHVLLSYYCEIALYFIILKRRTRIGV